MRHFRDLKIHLALLDPEREVDVDRDDQAEHDGSRGDILAVVALSHGFAVDRRQRQAANLPGFRRHGAIRE